MTAAIESISWVDTAGVEHQWPHQLLRGMSGRGMPPIEVTTRTVSGRPGSVRTGARWGERRINVPLLLSGPSESVRAQMRSWSRWLATVSGTGLLRVATVDGQQRQIAASVVGGLQLDEQTAWVQTVDVEFAAHDPLWEDTVLTTAVASGAAPRLFFPGFPLQLSTSELLVQLSINNDGDDPTWPVIRITGPATNPAVVLPSSGDRLALTGTVATGAIVTIDTRPGAKTIVDQSGASLFPSLSSAQFFALPTGISRVELQATGATTATTISMEWRRRWLTV